MKRCLRITYIDGCEPNEVYPLDDSESAVSCFSILNQLDSENIKVDLVTLTDEEWTMAEKLGEENS